MCGRFTLTSPGPDVGRLFEVEGMPSLKPRYNIAPSQVVLGVRASSLESSRREAAPLQWGLVPSWAKDPAIGNRMINARAETVVEKPAFRTAFRRRRCLIPSNGYYEWQQRAGHKQPYLIRMADDRPFAMAGLWELWEGPDGVIESCAILTTEPNDLTRAIHLRMPVILKPDDWTLWLDARVQQPERLLPLTKPYRADEMAAFPVSTYVNNPANDDPRCVEPASLSQETGVRRQKSEGA